ncbi:MAG TPA: glycosyltransferase 87 family protein [Acidimicrobiia bacterium]|nr:glycosyltransferase 87 family protein [Acidimicrobiia bacterium]
MKRLVARWDYLPFAVRVVILSALVFGAWLLLVGHTLGNTPVFGYIRGGTADWLVTNEAWRGGDPYAPLDQIAEQRLGWQDMRPTDPHPRPPSALLLLGPLALIPSASVIVILAAVGAVCLAFWTSASVRWIGLTPRAEFLVVPLALTPPSLHSVVWGSHIPILAAFLGVALMRKVNIGFRAGGIAFAAGYKLFPFLLALAHGRGRVRRVALAGSMFLGITIAGLALPGVDLEEAFSAMIKAPENYGAVEASDVNLSLNGTVGWSLGAMIFPLVGVAAVLVASRYLSDRGATAFALIAMVVLAPYAWPEYMILWLPALLYLWTLGNPPRIAVLFFLVTIAITRDGRTLLVAGLILAATIVLMEMSARQRDRLAAGSSPPL